MARIKIILVRSIHSSLNFVKITHLSNIVLCTEVPDTDDNDDNNVGGAGDEDGTRGGGVIILPFRDYNVLWL